MNGNTITSMFYYFVIVLTIYPIIELFNKNRKLWLRVIIGIAIVSFLVLSIYAKNIDDRDKNNLTIKNDSLQNNIKEMKDQLIQKEKDDSTRLKRLQDSLLIKFDIVIDSVTNSPRKVYIKQASHFTINQ